MYFNEEVDGFYVSEEAFADRNRNYGWDFQKNPLGLRLAGVGCGDYWDYNNKNRMDLLNRETDVRARWYDYFFWYPFIGLLNSHFYNQNP